MGEAKYTPGIIIEQFINCVNKGDTGAFYGWAERYRDSLSRTGEAYPRLVRLLGARPVEMTLLDNLNATGSKLKGLVNHCQSTEENVFMSTAVRAFLDPLLTEWTHRDLYAYHNIGVRTKLLLHGPTGNGKTTLARYLARQARLPLVQVETDSIIDSHLGRTGRNINDVFNSIKEPCLLFWDEVDSVGRSRGSGQLSTGTHQSAVLENERMVNSMLVNLERLSPKVIFVGATNRRDVLDSAILRRFDSQFEVPAPTRAEKQAYAQQLLTFHQLTEQVAAVSFEQELSYADVRLRVLEAARAYLAQEILSRRTS